MTANKKARCSFGIIASRFVYETAIRHSLSPIDLAGYSRIKTDVKEIGTPAWMKLFDVRVSMWYSSAGGCEPDQLAP
jgi:hypothetical protein